MKKFLTLALALVMVLGLAAPALAYTTNVAPEQGVTPYSVRIYLVEYKDVDVFSGWITMPPSDRGYATNEVIAFVGELTVPKDKDVYGDWYRIVQFKTKNVNLWVTDNYVPDPNHAVAKNTAVPWLANTVGSSWNGTVAASPLVAWTISGDGNTKLTHDIKRLDRTDSVIYKPDSQKTFKWLGFGKVTGDDATVSFVLSRNAKFFDIMPLGILGAGWPASSTIPARPGQANKALVVSEDYVVLKAAAGNGAIYFVYENGDEGFGWGWDTANDARYATGGPVPHRLGQLLFAIETVNSAGKTDRMWVFPGGEDRPAYRLHTEPSKAYMDIMYSAITGQIASGKREGDQVTPDSALYNDIVTFYNRYVVDAFGFDAWNRGNLMKDGDWEKVAAAAWDISDTVDVEPWTPYVAVPENIVTDPPKTGDASVLGFVMIALAAAAAVVVKKVRA